MKAIIKKLLDELIGLTPLAESTLLNKAFEEMGVSDARDVARKLLFWQKGIDAYHETKCTQVIKLYGLNYWVYICSMNQNMLTMLLNKYNNYCG